MTHHLNLSFSPLLKYLQIPDLSIFDQNTVGDSGFENVYIYGKLNYDFGSEDIALNSLNVTGISSFTGNIFTRFSA